MPQPIKPTAILKMEKGKLYDKQRARAESEPKQKREMIPRCPANLTKQQKAQWKFFSEILDNYGLLCAANAAHLQLLAVNVALYNEALEKVAKAGMIILSPGGVPVYNPYFSAMNKLESKIVKCLSELGLSSIGLARIGSLVVKAKETASGMEALID